MAFDGTLKFDTAIDKSGFEAGLAKLGSIAKTGMVAIAGAITAASGAVAALGTKALEAYSDYEQLTGGVATLFGAQDMSLEAYAQSVGKTVDAVRGEYDTLLAAQDTVMHNAAAAFRTAGLSQNAYMETVTSFSAALIASLDGDTAKAAQTADRAIVDMADNANKMGSSMESIQNAYQGFAKQNYTMLDNLKLGYGGTKTEMERLLADAQKISGIEYHIDSYADVVEAIHVIQSEMHISGITAEEAAQMVASGALTEEKAFNRMGTTAKEATSTIQGSMGAAKAAFSNLLVGIVDDEQDFESLVDDFVGSVSTAAGNILPRVETIIGGAGKLITSLSGVAADLLVDVLAYTPDLLGAGISLVEAIIGGFREQLPALTDTAAEVGLSLLEGIVSISTDMVQLGTELLLPLADALIAGVPVLVDAALQIILTLAQAILDNIPQIIANISTVITNIVDFIIQAVPMLLDAAVQLLMAMVDALPVVIDALTQELPRILDTITKLIPQIVSAITKALPQVVDAVVQALPVVIQALVQALPQIITAVVDGLLSCSTQLLDGAIQLFSALLDAIPAVAEALLPMLPDLIEAMVSNMIDAHEQLFEAAVTLFMAIVEAFPQIIETIGTYFGKLFDVTRNWLGTIASDAWQTVKDGFAQMISSAKQSASDLVSGAMAFLNALPEKIGYMLGSAMAHIIRFAAEAPAKAKSAAENFLHHVVAFFKELPGKTKEWLDKAIQNVVQWAADLAAKGKESAANLVKIIVDGIAALPDKMREAGKNLVEGLWNGISKMGEWIRDKISGFGKGIISGFKDVFGIASPSKVMRDSVGKYLAEGLGDGFTREMPQIGKDALEAFQSIRLPSIKVPKVETAVPNVDAQAVRLLSTQRHSIAPIVQPSPTSEITNNYNTYNTKNNQTDSTPPIINVHVHVDAEMDGDKVAEKVAEKVDILQGETIILKERGTVT